MKTYPDISRLIEAKKEQRRRLAQLPIEEKFRILKQWRDINLVFAEIRKQVQLEFAAVRVESEK